MRKQVQYRLLVVRLGAMGDILHALPAVTALREAHPAWVIDWAVDPRWRPLLSAEPLSQIPLLPEDASGSRSAVRPLVDHLHLVPSKEWGQHPFRSQTWASIRGLRSHLRAGSYDAVLDLQGAIRSSIVGRLTGSNRILGDASPRERPARWFYSELVETTSQHVIEQAIELASAIAGDLLLPTPAALPIDLDAEEWCDRQEEIRRAEWTHKPLILIHPGAGWGAKRWPAERYAAVAAEFSQRGAVVLVNVGPGEETIAEIAAGAGHPSSAPHATIIQGTLPQLIAMTRRATLVIGGDTGPAHLASALGKPVVGIYGPTDPKRNGPYGAPFRVLRNPESRRDHTRREPPEAGLLTITPESVIAAAIELLLATRQQRSEEEARSRGETPQNEPVQAEGQEPALNAELDAEAAAELAAKRLTDAEAGVHPAQSSAIRRAGRA